MRPPPDSLSALLRRADPAAGAAPQEPAAFAAAVHGRIRAADLAPLAAARAFGRQLLPLAAALALLASVGAGSALAYARERDARAEAFATAYVRSIDPWQMHGPGPAPGHVHR